MSVLPPEGDAVLSVHPDAVAARLVALQQLEAIAGWNHEIINRAAESSSLSFRWMTRHSSRGMRRAARVFRWRNRSS